LYAIVHPMNGAWNTQRGRLRDNVRSNVAKKFGKLLQTTMTIKKLTDASLCVF